MWRESLSSFWAESSKSLGRSTTPELWLFVGCRHGRTARQVCNSATNFCFSTPAEKPTTSGPHEFLAPLFNDSRRSTMGPQEEDTTKPKTKVLPNKAEREATKQDLPIGTRVLQVCRTQR